jgi:DNA-directed RNA polymerase subunit RPC12/RpoP
MTARCTICGREWIIAAEQDKPGYICPHCATRDRLIQAGFFEGS